MRVFVSHGHDEANRRRFVDFIMKLDDKAVVLVDDFEPGKTIVEKLESAARGVDCAVILFTGDDRTDAGGARARQNVIHELGYFHAQLGRDRLILLVEEGVELPSNLAGLERIDFPRATPQAADWTLSQALVRIRSLPPRDFRPQPVLSMNWTLTALEPTALLRINRKTLAPIVVGANPAFLSLFDYPNSQLPSPDSPDAVTWDQLTQGLSARDLIVDAPSLIAAQASFFKTMFDVNPQPRSRTPLRIRRPDRPGDETLYLSLVGRGIVDDVHTTEFASCLVIYAEESAVYTRDGILSLRSLVWNNLKSQNVVTVVLAKSRGGKLQSATIEVATIDAARFYGLGPYDADRLEGKNGEDLQAMLRPFMSKNDHAAFVDDQTRVFAEYEKSGRAWADVPIRFNALHPEKSFKNTTHYPIISHSIRRDAEGEEHEYIHVLYVSLENLLEHLPLEGAVRNPAATA